MAKLILVILALVSTSLAISTKEFTSVLAAHDESGHGDRFLLCSDMPGEVTLELHAFSIKNPADIKNGATPQLEELTDTIIYKDLGKKTNCSVNVEDFNINYQRAKQWTKITENTNVMINTVNVPLQRLGPLVKAENHHDVFPAGETYLKSDIALNELLHSGVDVTQYRDAIANVTNLIPRGELPELEKESFALLRDFNTPTKYSLSSEESTYGNIALIDDQATLGWWSQAGSGHQSCSKFAGSTGELFSSKIGTTPLHFYSEDICGTATLIFDSVDTTAFAFPTHKFRLYDQMLDTSCSCPKTSPDCKPAGVVDVSSCQKGLPYFVSQPHFFGADAEFGKALSGMNPAGKDYQSYFWIEPTTGMLIESSQKFQLNVDLKKFDWDTISVNMPKSTIVPMYWYEKKYKLDETHLKGIEAMLKNPTTPTTTTTTPAPGQGGSDAGSAHKEVEVKLDDISKQLRVMSTVTFIFAALTVIMLVVFSFIQFHQNKKAQAARQPSLPDYFVATKTQQ